MNQLPLHRAEALSIQQVVTFCRVFELGGYAQASEELGLAGPTMWEQVKTLEKIYRTSLFVRVGRSIQPTPAGQTLHKMLSPLLATVESTFEVLADQMQSGSKQIRMVTGVRMMLEELGEPLRQFLAGHPEHQLKLMTADNQAAQEFVLEDKADIALLIEPPRAVVLPGITCHSLYPIDYLVAFPPRHKLTRRARFELSDLEHEPLIVGNPHTVGRQMLEHAWFRHGIKTPMKVVVETDNSAITIACVRAGTGIGIIAGQPDGNLTKHISTKPLSKELGKVSVVAAIRSGRHLTNALETLLKILSRLGTRDDERT
jgi:DNA-binding transcriptional LysR family regulator